MLRDKRILLIVSGGIAAYKALELVRLIRREGGAVRCVLTASGARFVTPLSLQALSGEAVRTDLWSLGDESEMGHIELSRSADLVVVAPASADLLARMAAGLADDLATTLLLATDTPVLVAPAMNVRMWEHAATRANVALLRERGVRLVGPDEGAMACNEWGHGRLSEPPAILEAIVALLDGLEDAAREAQADAAAIAAELEAEMPGEGRPPLPLAGRHALVTAGPTHEPIDPVRYIANRSSGRQGYAVAAALAALGARVTLVSGPTALPDPPGVETRRVTTAAEMLAACRDALPADVAVCAAAVADWRADAVAPQKLKKPGAGAPPPLALAANADVLAALAAAGPRRPALVVGFAAETEAVLDHARAKRFRKGCDWIVANDVSGDVFGGGFNRVHLVTESATEDWPLLPKAQVAERLALRVAAALRPDAPPPEGAPDALAALPDDGDWA